MAAVVFMAAMLPLGLVLALIIWLHDRGPVFLRQQRYGQHKQPFTLYKFRSMLVDAPSAMPTNQLHNSNKYITPIGRIMRKLSLDELPQLINVLKGEMSIVGPRPVVLCEADLIAERDKYGANACKPGITGWAQVNGRDEVRLVHKARMDGEYAYRLGLRMDLKCLLYTIYAVLSLKGHREGADTEAAEYYRKKQHEPKSSKKVLFTSHTANFSKFNRPFMRLLAEQGYEVHYASAGEEEVLDCQQHHTVPFTRSPFRLRNLSALRQLRRIIERENYDIIHTHTPMGSVVTRLAARKARRTGTKVIYTAHGFHFYKGAPLINWLVYYPIEKYMARHTDILITINQEDFQRASKKFRTDVRYVPGVGIDIAKFSAKMPQADKLALRKSLGLKANDFVMIYVAELSKRKNQLWLIKAIADLIKNDSKLHLLLVGQDSLNGKCQKLAVKLGLTNNIHFLGYRNDVPQLMKISNLAVSSSRQEGLPVNIMEAMAVGLPVVASGCRGNFDLLNNIGKGCTRTPIKHAEAFAEDIIHLRNDKRSREQYIRVSRSMIKSYSIENVLMNMTDIYAHKKTILHVLASNKFSGAESIACEIISATSENYRVVYCSPSGPIQKTLAQRAIPYCELKRLSRKELGRLVRNYRPEVIHAHDFRASIIASFFKSKARIISHIHQNPEWLNNPRSINALLYRSRISGIHRIILVTHAIKETRLFAGLPEDKITVLPNSINVQRIFDKAKEPAPKYDVLFCGRLEEVKQPLDFIEIIAKIKKKQPNVRAAMIGDGSMMKDCQQLIRKRKLVKTIDTLGFQENPYKYMRRAKFLIITSKNEGFGLVVVEATMLGTIVLSYDLPAVRETIGSQGLSRHQHDLLTQYSSFLHDRETYRAESKIRKANIQALLRDRRSFQLSLLEQYVKGE